MKQKRDEAKFKLTIVEQRLQEKEKKLESEINNSAAIKRQMKKSQMQIDDLNEQIEQINSRKSQENLEKEQIQSFINTRLFEIKFIRQIQILQGMESTMKSMQDKEKTSEERR